MIAAQIRSHCQVPGDSSAGQRNPALATVVLFGHLITLGAIVRSAPAEAQSTFYKGKTVM